MMHQRSIPATLCRGLENLTFISHEVNSQGYSYHLKIRGLGQNSLRCFVRKLLFVNDKDFFRFTDILGQNLYH